LRRDSAVDTDTFTFNINYVAMSSWEGDLNSRPLRSKSDTPSKLISLKRIRKRTQHPPPFPPQPHHIPHKSLDLIIISIVLTALIHRLVITLGSSAVVSLPLSIPSYFYIMQGESDSYRTKSLGAVYKSTRRKE
jgi:hypothetical protein